jgi:hypothetical protein
MNPFTSYKKTIWMSDSERMNRRPANLTNNKTKTYLRFLNFSGFWSWQFLFYS